MTKTVSQLDSVGYLLGPAVADPSPLEEDVWLLPALCVDVAPVDVPVGFRAKFNGVGFDLEAIPDNTEDPPPPPTQQEIIQRLSGQIQKRLDDFAGTRKYDNVVSLSKYTDITDTEIALLPTEDQAAVTRYRSECRHLLLKVAQTWAVSDRILAEVMNNQRPVPASIADFEAELPALTWPA